MTFPSDITNGLAGSFLVAANPPPASLSNANGNGTIQGARFINLQTGDFALDNNGNFVGMDPIQQQVELALLTTFNSAAAPIGQTFFSTLTITKNFQIQMQNAVQTALADLLNANEITLSSVDVTKLPNGRGQIVVNFVNNVSGQTFQSNVILGVS